MNIINFLKNSKSSIFKTLNHNNITFKLTNQFTFVELEKNYQFFKKLPPLNITISTTTTKNSDLLFLLKSYKLY